jgi:hypothetical protein
VKKRNLKKEKAARNEEYAKRFQSNRDEKKKAEREAATRKRIAAEDAFWAGERNRRDRPRVI